MKYHPVRLLLAVLVTLSLAGCAPGGQNATPTPFAALQDVGALINATGVVVPLRWAALSVSVVGVVRDLPVKEGDFVRSGQVLLRLDGQAAAQASLDSAQYDLIVAQQALDALHQHALVETAQAEKALADARQALEDAQKDVDKLAYRRASDDLIKQTRDEIDLAKRQVSRAEDAFKLVKKRPEGDALRAEAELALVKARQYLDNRISLLNWYLGKPDDVDAARYRAALALAQAALTHAEEEYERRRNGPDADLLAQAEARLTLVTSQVAAAREALANLELRAPFDGVVCSLGVRAGEWVSPGMVVLQLADLNALRVETTDLGEIDAARVHVGDAALITFDALPDVRVQAGVVSVGNRPAQGSGVNYTVVLEMKEIPPGLRWGMTAFADIQVSP